MARLELHRDFGRIIGRPRIDRDGLRGKTLGPTTTKVSLPPVYNIVDRESSGGIGKRLVHFVARICRDWSPTAPAIGLPSPSVTSPWTDPPMGRALEDQVHLDFAIARAGHVAFRLRISEVLLPADC